MNGGHSPSFISPFPPFRILPNGAQSPLLSKVKYGKRFEQNAMNYEVVEETIKAGYRAVSSQYRRDDEIEVTTANHHRICNTLQRICGSFPHPIRVLDVGCGTGR